MREFRAVVEGDGAAKIGRQGTEGSLDALGDRGGRLARQALHPHQARGAFVQSENGLTGPCELNRIGLPMPGDGAVDRGALGDGDSMLDEPGGAAALAAAEAALGFASGQVVAPGVVLRPGDLSVDEPVDRLVADHLTACFQCQPPRNILGGAPPLEQLKNGGLELGLALELAALPAPGVGLLAGVFGQIALHNRAIAFQLPSNARWRAIQSCRDLPERLPGVTTPGNLTPFFNREMAVFPAFHRNTPLRECCTSFVNSRDPICFFNFLNGIPAFAGTTVSGLF